MNIDRKVSVAIIGAGTAGLYATPDVRDATEGDFLLIEAGNYGTTCARTGGMPSKALVRFAEQAQSITELRAFQTGKVSNAQIDQAAILRHIRKLRDRFVARVVNSMKRIPANNRMQGFATFVEPNILKVRNKLIQADKIILATGSSPVIPEGWEKFSDRILTTDTLFEQKDLPPAITVIGLSGIGLELGQALQRLGIEISGFDFQKKIAGLQDPVVNKTAIHLLHQEMPLWLGRAVRVKEDGRQLRVFSGDNSELSDKLLITLGRRPNLKGLGLERFISQTDARGIPSFDRTTMQIADYPIFLAGDIDGESTLFHEACDEGRIAAYNSCYEKQAFQRKQPFHITFTDPNIVQIGKNWHEIKGDPNITIAELNFQLQNRAVMMGEDHGILRLYADKTTHKLVGAAMIAPRGEHLGHLLAWSIEQGQTVGDLLKMPFYHPGIEEGLQTTLYQLYARMRDRNDKKPPELHVI